MVRGTRHVTTAEIGICRLQEANAAALASTGGWHTCSKSQHQLIKRDREWGDAGQGGARGEQGGQGHCVSGTAFTYDSLKPAWKSTQNSKNQALTHRPVIAATS